MRITLYDNGAGGTGGGGGGAGTGGTGAGTPPGVGAGGGGSGAGTPWYSVLPPELQSEPTIKNVPDVATLAKNYLNAERMIGQKRLAVPGANATDAQWSEVWNTLGRPESHDKYSQPTVKLKDGVNADAAALGKARETFHKLGLNDSQARGIMDFYLSGLNDTHSQVNAQMETSRSQATESLRKDWGDRFEPNMDIAKAALRQFGGDDVFAELEAGLGNHTGLIKMLHKIGTGLLETRAPNGTSGGLAVQGKTGALAEIDSLKLDADFQKALNDNRHTGHNAAVARWMDLFRRAHPGKIDVAG